MRIMSFTIVIYHSTRVGYFLCRLKIFTRNIDCNIVCVVWLTSHSEIYKREEIKVYQCENLKKSDGGGGIEIVLLKGICFVRAVNIQ